jgi:hypothetical protein
MKQTLKILINRWPEVLLVLLFTGGAVLLFSQSDDSQNTMNAKKFIVAMGTGIFFVLGYIFQFGFLRTVVLAENEQFQPKELLFLGRKFLGRFIIFGLILAVVIVLFSQIILSILLSVFGNVNPDGLESEQIQNLPVWMPLTAVLTSMAILLKLWLFMPAVIIVKDCPLRECWQYVRSVKLFKALEIWLWLGLMVILNLIGYYVGTKIKPGEEADIATTASLIFVSGFVSFAMQLAAVRYVKGKI